MKHVLQRWFGILGYKILKINKSIYSVCLYEKYSNFTMISKEFFCANISLCERFKDIDGDIVECGVWRGGMIAGIAEIMGDKDRVYYLFDSFEGLPIAKEIDGDAALAWQNNVTADNYFDNCKAEIKFAETAMKLSGIINYRIIKGWFENTLENPDIKKIAILRLDADWYESIYMCMEKLFPKLAHNGLLIIDDYYIWEGTSRAIHDYLSKIKSSSRVYTLNEGIAYVIKTDKM